MGEAAGEWMCGIARYSLKNNLGSVGWRVVTNESERRMKVSDVFLYGLIVIGKVVILKNYF